MISIKSEREIELLSIAGAITYDTFQYLKDFIKPGITTNELNELAKNYIISKDATPAFENYEGYPKAICTSPNEQVVHGIPSDYKLKDGDIISIDIGACYKGYYGDSAWTYPVGKIDSDKEYLLKHTERSLYEGLRQVKPGNRIGDIGHAIEEYANSHNLGIVRELVGHGVGTALHEEPDIPNYGKAGVGPLLKPGMVLAIEPMLNFGSDDVVLEDDDWTVSTYDRSPSAHFEHTVVVTMDGCTILTKR
jgi:methionyl aminopeptidase